MKKTSALKPLQITKLPYFCHVKCAPTSLAQTFRKKIFHFNFLIQLFIYLYLERKLIIIFQGIILYVDISIAS